MFNSLIDYLIALPNELTIFLVAALPIFELRGAIPLGLTLGVPVAKTFLLALAGNILPVIPLLLFLEPLSDRLQRFRLWRKFFEWLFNRTKKRAEMVNKYKILDGIRSRT